MTAAAATTGAAVVAYVRTGSGSDAGLALLAGTVAVAVAGLALTLPGITVRGATIGGLVLAAGICTYTYASRPLVIWLVLAVAGAVGALWSRPWRRLPALPRLGSAWLGLAYWPLGVAGALLVGHLTVAGQRIVYTGLFLLFALAVAARGQAGEDLTVGIAAAMLVAVAALLLAGSGSLFHALHAVPDEPSAQLMRDRFWGGPGLFYHPNSMSALAVVAAVRIGPDRAFATWQRLAVTGIAGGMLVVTDSRSGFVFAAAGAVVHAALALRRWGAGLPDYRRRWLAAPTPFAVLVLVLLLSGGTRFLVRDRFNPAGTDVTSGRVDTWRQVVVDWRHAGPAGKLFGDATTSRAVVTRTNDGAPPQGPRRKLTTDNAAVGALRRGGVLGLAAFLLGLVLLVRHAAGRAGTRAPAAWFAIAVGAALATIPTEDWLLGGTNGAVWLLLLAGEANVMRPAAEEVRPALPAAARPSAR